MTNFVNCISFLGFKLFLVLLQDLFILYLFHFYILFYIFGDCVDLFTLYDYINK